MTLTDNIELYTYIIKIVDIVLFANFERITETFSVVLPVNPALNKSMQFFRFTFLEKFGQFINRKI